VAEDPTPSRASGDGATALTTAPEEDSGAATQDRYRWQHHCTAADALMMLKDPDIRGIVCEIHEDYVVSRNARQELVSCKHREPSQGPWTLNDLCLHGGVAHLFSRWALLPGVICRLMTNAGLRPGAAGPAAMASACADPDCTDFNQCRDSLARSLLWARQRKAFPEIPLIAGPRSRSADAITIPDGFAERVTGFMSALNIKSELAGRPHINEYHVNAVAIPILEASGYDGSLGSSCYQSILEIVRSRNMADALTGEYANWLTGPNIGPRGQLAALVQARTITVEDVRSALQAKRPRNLLRPFPTKGHERLRAKLIAGGVRETRINGATRLREAWLATWAEMRSGLPGDEAERHDVETRVLDVAGDIEAQVARTGEGWGDEMYENLRARFDQGAVVPGSTLQLSTAHLMGVAMDLTASCQLWFSEPFDVDAAINAAATATGPSAETGDRIGHA
jgi:hypothetical protein